MIKGRAGNGGSSFGHLFLPLLVLGLITGLVSAASPKARADGAHKHRERTDRRIERVMAEVAAGTAPASAPASPSGSRVYHVTDYGADPTGSADSTSAIRRAISDAFNAPSDHDLMAGIKDVGGAELHLDGGSYLISNPVALPSSGGGNFRIHGGSLRASDDFPTDRYLIELWSSAASSSQSARAAANATELLSTSGYDYEYITLRDLMLDANYRGGGVAVVNSLRTTIDNCYIVHFESDGVWVKGGHETFIRGNYIGQHITAGGDPGERNFSGNGINLNGNDNAVTDTVIFSAATGVLVSGQANTLTGVHCYNKATAFGGTGIYLKLPNLTQTRIVNCYLDFTSIVSEDPVQLVVSNSFFLGGGNVVFKSVKGVIKSVNVVDNLFSGGKGTDIVRLDETNGGFTDVDGVFVERNGVDGMTARSTAARATVKSNGTTWTVDFSPVLLFPNRIDHVLYSLQAESGFPNHALRNVSSNRVVIQAGRGRSGSSNRTRGG
ncbi:uncharacterized protein A4U43_C06F1380 [Asparagus officinalis]|uniref:Rhamnogalacturonase A/B/Epimerase-like pectate lyase domain-containing protein n=1 Tax=Asparagus officinalis TaxID=4686 RepID=A0A5P1EKV1_ASPOF|nr:uncharacterized protein A4U43_C06F1380 [Asparagus officinalis]